MIRQQAVRCVWALMWCMSLAGCERLQATRAQAESTTSEPELWRLDGLDPLQLAHRVQSLDDTRVLAGLAEDQPVDVQLRAVHAAPWLRRPLDALAPLASLAAGRDSALAPAAAHAAHRIAADIDADALARHDVWVDVLIEPREAYAQIAADESIRGDIRLYAAGVASALAQLSPPRE